jgi:hypothetical protein
MRKVLVVLIVALGVFLYLNRMRVFLRDPLAKVTRDGAPVEGAQAFINYPNDVLLNVPAKGAVPANLRRIYLIQHWNLTPETPATLQCLNALACMTDADQATAKPVVAGARGRRSPFEGVTMTDRRVEFVDEDGGLVQVVLR